MTEGSKKNHVRMRIFFIGLRKFIVLGFITIIFAGLYLKLEEISNPEPSKMVARDCGDLDLQATYRLKRPGSWKFTEVHAKNYWNASGIIFEKGVTYKIHVFNPDQATWKDATQEVTWKDACHEDSPNKGWWPKEGSVFWLSELGRLVGILRARDQDLFVLMGAFYGICEDGRTCAAHFPIGNGDDFTAPADGEFCAYANDLPFTYGNNSGSITARIIRK